MKKPKVDGKVRIGGETKIGHGNKSGGMGPGHSMSDGVHHVGHVPADVGKFDQDRGGKGDKK